MLFSKGDTHYCQAKDKAYYQMSYAKLQPEKQEPDYIAYQAQGSESSDFHAAAERPQYKTCDFETLAAKRDPDDCDTQNQPCHEPAYGSHQPSKQKPYQITNETHFAPPKSAFILICVLIHALK
jgi:hypothetical protein